MLLLLYGGVISYCAVLMLRVSYDIVTTNRIQNDKERTLNASEALSPSVQRLWGHQSARYACGTPGFKIRNPPQNKPEKNGGTQLTWRRDVAQRPRQRPLAVGPPPAPAHVDVHTLARHKVLLVLAGVPVGVHRVAAVRPLVVLAVLGGNEVTGSRSESSNEQM